MPFDRKRYPPDWPAISRRIRARSGGRCEGPLSSEWDGAPPDDARCAALNYQPHPVTGTRVVFTVAHVHDPDPMNCSDSNLAAVCQRCHLAHDRAHHIAKAKRRRRAARACGDLFLGAHAIVP